MHILQLMHHVRALSLALFGSCMYPVQLDKVLCRKIDCEGGCTSSASFGAKHNRLYLPLFDPKLVYVLQWYYSAEVWWTITACRTEGERFNGRAKRAISAHLARRSRASCSAIGEPDLLPFSIARPPESIRESSPPSGIRACMLRAV